MNTLLNQDSQRFGVLLTASLLVHVVLLVSIKFVAPELKKWQDNMPALDVVLVNAKTKHAPKKADLLAQANLDRGGNVDENRHMKSPLPVPKVKNREQSNEPATDLQTSSSKAAESKSEQTPREAKIAELERQAQELMTQIKAKQTVEKEATQQITTNSDPDTGHANPTLKSLNASDLVARSLDAARLEGQIAKDWDNYQKRPKRKFLGASTQEFRFATYVEGWRQKVENIGTLNYPDEARRQKIYGQLRMTVSIRADGTIEKIEINKSSGQKILDDAAERIVRLGEPYSAFPADIKKDTDIISITRTWSFTQSEKLSGE